MAEGVAVEVAAGASRVAYQTAQKGQRMLEVAEVIRTPATTSGHQNTKWATPTHIPSKRFHQLVTLLGATTDMVE